MPQKHLGLFIEGVYNNTNLRFLKSGSYIKTKHKVMERDRDGLEGLFQKKLVLCHWGRVTLKFGIKQVENKGVAKLGNIVAETMFLVMFPGVAKLGNICFGRKICVWEAKMFLTPGKNNFRFPSSKICFRNTCLPRR